MPALARSPRERIWMNTLNALSAYQMYRQHVGVHVEGPDVVRFLLRDPHFPRTVQHCLAEIESCLTVLGRYEEPMGVARMRLAAPGVDALRPRRRQPAARRSRPSATDLGTLHNAIAQQYFTLHQQPRLQPWNRKAMNTPQSLSFPATATNSIRPSSRNTWAN
jgi:uncharacterized alpha-E superfamily protein